MVKDALDENYDEEDVGGVDVLLLDEVIQLGGVVRLQVLVQLHTYDQVNSMGSGVLNLR